MSIKISLGKSKDLDPITKHRLIFNKIDNVQSDSIMFFSIAQFEIEPLIVTFSIDIVLHNQIVGLNLQGLFSVSVQ